MSLTPSRLVSLWIGERLSLIERACLRSMLAMGHEVRLYCYDPPYGVPAGVDLHDAATILPRDAIVQHSSGSVALFSDYFRFELQRRGEGLWLDTDVYLLQPLAFSSGDPVFGWQDATTLGSAVLYLPPDCPIITPVLRLFEDPYIPDWLSPRDRIRARWRARGNRRIDLSVMPWGVAGPFALTALARRHGMLGHAQPRSIFYPYHWKDANWAFAPEQISDADITRDTKAIHLYNYLIAARKDEPAPVGSFMDRLQQEGI